MSAPTPIQDASHFVRNAPTAELSKSIQEPESFKIIYFPINAAGACSRELLAYGKDKFSFKVLAPSVRTNACYVHPRQVSYAERLF